jgi:hypothetical protein
MAMPIPTSQQWLSDTSMGVFRPRSAQLKAIDEAIKRYEQARTTENLQKIKNALEDWKRSKGPIWMTSERNRSGAVTRLDQELGRIPAARLTPGELQALKYMGSERKKVISKLFEGKELTFRNSPKAMTEAVKDAGEKVKETCAQAESWLSGAGKKSVLSPADKAKQKLEEMAKSLFSVDSLDSLGGLTFLIVDIIGKCGVSIAPVVGHIKDGYDLFTGWAKAGAALHEQCSISECRYAIDTGIPEVAFSALKACLVEETKKESAAASIATTSFALKTGLAFVDGGAISGPVVGAANAIAALSLQLYYLATEYRATKGINKALEAGELDIRLFKTYPLMGCYMLTSATFSDLIPIDNFGTPGWMDYVERLKKRSFDGIYEASNKLIDNSPWEIKGLPKRPMTGAGIQTGMFTTVKEFGSNVKEIFS